MSNILTGFCLTIDRTGRPEQTVVSAREYRDDDIVNYQKIFTMHHLVKSYRGDLLLVSCYDLGYKKVRFEVNMV